MTFMDIDLDQVYDGYSQILITSHDAATVRVKVPFAGRSTYQKIKWNPSSFYNFTDNEIGFPQDPQMTVVENKGAIVITNGTVDVTGAHVKAGSGESYLSLRLTKNSREFYIPSYPTMQTGNSIYAIAAAADACVDVFRIVAGQYKSHKSISLKAGDVYQEYGRTNENDCGNANTIDFTGLNIQSSQGVAVFSGHECAQLPCGTQFCDHLMEQIPPVSQWGGEMVVPGLPDRNPLAQYMLRIVASASTIVNFPYHKDKVLLSASHGCDCKGTGMAAIPFNECTQDCTTEKGQFIEVMISVATLNVIVECSPACLVTQYGRSRYVVASETNDPDPFMMVVTPTDHYVYYMSYATPDYLEPGTKRLFEYINYLAIVVATSDKDGVRLDDNTITGTETVIGAYTVITIITVSFGQHKIVHTDPSVRICAFAYGSSPPASGSKQAARTSYAFPVAYRIDGDTIKGNWTLELVPLPGEVDVVTPAPRHCTQIEELSVHETFTLKVDQVLSCPVSQEVVNKILPELNDAICQGLICPGVSENVFVKYIRPVQISQEVQLEILLLTTMDTSMSALVGCKGHIIDYVRRPQHWTSGLTTDQMLNCIDVFERLELSHDAHTCASGFISG